MHLTYRYRVKSKIGRLNEMARAVNVVWNYCNDAQKFALKHPRKWPSGYDLMKATSGSSKELGISSQTITAICARYEQSRRQLRKPALRYRGRKSLGWIPLKANCIVLKGAFAVYFGLAHRLAFSRPIPDGARIVDGSSFSMDASGRWYLNLTLEVRDPPAREIERKIGIDLGLKTLATLSNGETVLPPKFYRRSERHLATVQRAKKRRAAQAIHAKIANRRKDFLHKLSARITREFDLICVGNVSSKAMARTNLAKSIHDAGWATFKNMLRYKAIARGATFKEVDESYSTQACSDCGVIGGPKGRQGLVIREWRCECGSVHDRDVNAARNILRAGHSAPIAGAVAA